MKETELNVKGMACEGCENRIKNALKNVEGVESVTADHVSGKVVVTAEEGVSRETMEEIITDIGFEIVR